MKKIDPTVLASLITAASSVLITISTCLYTLNITNKRHSQILQQFFENKKTERIFDESDSYRKKYNIFEKKCDQMKAEVVYFDNSDLEKYIWGFYADHGRVFYRENRGFLQTEDLDRLEAKILKLTDPYSSLDSDEMSEKQQLEHYVKDFLELLYERSTTF